MLTTDVLAAREFVPVRMVTMQETCPRALAEISDHDNTHHADRRPVLFTLPAAWLRCAATGRDYRVDQDEELVEVFSRLAWRRVSAFVHLPAIGMNGQTHQMVPIDPAALEAAIEKDHQS